MDSALLLILIALGLGAFFQTAMGFGSALVAMPLMTLVIPATEAAPVQAIVATALAVWVLYLNWEGFHFHEAKRLILASLLGLPIGIVLLKFGAPRFTLLLLGLLLVVYPIHALFIEPRLVRRVPPHEDLDAETRRWGSYIAGFAAGVLGGAYATNGPPLVIYGGIRRWPKQQLRAVLQTFFIVNDVFIVGGHYLSGLTTVGTLKYVGMAVPFVLVGIAVGTWLDRYLHPERFRPLLMVVLLLMGLWMIGQNFVASG